MKYAAEGDACIFHSPCHGGMANHMDKNQYSVIRDDFKVPRQLAQKMMPLGTDC